MGQGRSSENVPLKPNTKGSEEYAIYGNPESEEYATYGQSTTAINRNPEARRWTKTRIAKILLKVLIIPAVSAGIAIGVKKGKIKSEKCSMNI